MVWLGIWLRPASPPKASSVSASTARCPCYCLLSLRDGRGGGGAGSGGSVGIAASSVAQGGEDAVPRPP
uniref:Uncharacterized protein n=1 Tax=Oryza sativa subsp. japonica TaxID=39947 RepID=Q6EN58_ORYSJ|nr:hypothetical protein [Oryza sativa Japonica Group]BAD29677.1 hypothetical protein [Oryza sativa Japonica Group]